MCSVMLLIEFVVSCLVLGFWVLSIVVESVLVVDFVVVE